MNNNFWFFSLVHHLWHICQELGAVCVKEHDALVKVVMLHGWGRVHLEQAVARLDLETVVGPWNHEIHVEAIIFTKKYLVENIVYSHLCGQGRDRGRQWLGRGIQSPRAASTYY